MYKKILVALENGPADERLLPHVSRLARQVGAELMLLHVADGWAARNFEQLELAESDEMKADSDYLESTAEQLRTTFESIAATVEGTATKAAEVARSQQQVAETDRPGGPPT